MQLLTDAARSVAANTVTGNILDGKAGRFARRQVGVRIYAVISAVGLLFTVFAGTRIAVDDQECLAIGTTVVRPDHLLSEFLWVPEDPVEELFIKIRNRTVGALTANTLVELI